MCNTFLKNNFTVCITHTLPGIFFLSNGAIQAAFGGAVALLLCSQEGGPAETPPFLNIRTEVNLWISPSNWNAQNIT